jgi:membrane associated rhomboid family serine protease
VFQFRKQLKRMFILLPVGVNYQTNRLPMVTFSLMGLNTLIYLISLIARLNGGEDTELWIFENLWLTPAYSGWYTYLTSMFVHAGFFHLLGNMIYLFLFGSCVEDAIGRWKFLIFYLVGGLAADFGHIAATPDHFASEIPLGGASGAVTACLAGFLVLFSKQEIEFRYFGFFFLRVFSGEFSLAAWLVISFWFAKDLLFAALSFAAESTGGGVAFAAHVGGFLGGLGLILPHHLLQRKSVVATSTPPWQPSLVTSRTNRAPTPVELNETPAIYLSDGGVESGPFTTHQVRQMVALGSISAEAFYWQDGMTEWSTIQDFSA